MLLTVFVCFFALLICVCVSRFFEDVQIFQKRSVGEEGRTTKITQTNKLSSILYGSSLADKNLFIFCVLAFVINLYAVGE